ncbi:MAG: bifunctional phosphopantothenoylcysteine decarboxylase/phosphopantothenate--cysteine ligase CoaBC [Desulfovibrio sp.]|jgi:phosphopantothenoylcysteine decarboxylase/phosphopantothenate--cysteine ligase|nr:bifunctional phosphopantothenoylcysteine decarboxylase/phosphopantothenate--cysteine ligase CoaBC [Desulfovibrio sp.]
MNTLLPGCALRNRRLHLGVCGSAAAYKAVEVMRMLQRSGVSVGVCLTEAAQRFISPLTFAALEASPVYTRFFADDEGVFAHLEPGGCAHAMLIAPAGAATLARLAGGSADTLLAAQALAFDGPLLLAPAMNPRMWAHPATRRNMEILLERGARCIRPADGRAACGDTGEGKLAPVPEIVFAAAAALLPQDWAGRRVLLTLGPTRERWDDVRYWSNPSTGRMGAALACAAALRGAAVSAVAGPGVPALPAPVRRIDVVSAEDMLAAALEVWPHADTGIFAAAVADFAPTPYGAGKFKKSGAASLSVDFTRNPDILGELGKLARPEQKILGFAAESENLEANARGKLRAKKMHLTAANLLGRPDSGFGGDKNTLYVVDCRGREEHWQAMSKADAAWRLLDWLSTL